MIKGNKLIITWCIEDVIERAKEKDIILSKKDAKEVLELTDKYHDCNIGISWETLDVWIDEVLHNKILKS